MTERERERKRGERESDAVCGGGRERENESGRKKEVKWEEERSEGQFSGVVKLWR